MHQRRHPSAAIAWMLFILLLPYVALPAFLLFGSRKVDRPRQPPTPSADQPLTTAWAVETVMALGGPAPAAYDDLHVHADGGAAERALLEAIDSARTSIDVCTYFMARDRLADTVLARLCTRALAGVRVRVLLDGLGSLFTGRRVLRRLARAGAAGVLFVPPLWSPLKGASNLRNHRKLIVVDAGQPAGRLWCGGRNLAAEYFTGTRRRPPWRDLTFDAGGPLVAQAARLFEHDWSFAGGQPQPPVASAPSGSPAAGAQFVASGPDQPDDTVHALLVTAAYRARARIALVTPYFVPESALLLALCLAARRGVAVDLLLPARSDQWLSDRARARALRSLAQAGARIWLHPGMVHAKLAVVDDVLALVGSANLDTRSLFLNYELMVAFHAPADVRRYREWFEGERASARQHAPERPGLARDVAEGMLLWLGFQL